VAVANARARTAAEGPSRGDAGFDRRARAAIAASIVSFVAVALVASVPASPFTPILPSSPSGPFHWLAGAIGLDALHGSALVATGVFTMVSAAAAFAWVLVETWRGRIPARWALGLAVAYHVALLFLPLLFSRDVYSYASYGKIAATYHANPYVATPATFPNDVLARFVGPKWFDTPAVYGPLWTQLSALVVRGASSVAAQVAVFRVIAIAASLVTVLVVSRVVRAHRPEREAFAVAALGLNPLVLFQSAASGHNDLLVALAVIVALALASARRDLLATGALALGTLVKVTAGVPLLLFVIARVAAAPKGERGGVALRHVAVAGGLAVIAAAPFLNREDPTLGIVELARHEGWLAPSRLFRRMFEAAGGDAFALVPRVVFPLVLLAVVVLLARAVSRDATVWRVGASWGLALIALMLLGPVLLPWYVVWALPLVWLVPRVPRIVLLGSSLALTVSQWTSEPASFTTAYDANIWFGHYVLTPAVVLLLGWFLLDLWRRMRSGAPLEDAPEHEAAEA
jgi:alpha-1,6-mannosyltransferase